MVANTTHMILLGEIWTQSLMFGVTAVPKPQESLREALGKNKVFAKNTRHFLLLFLKKVEQSAP